MSELGRCKERIFPKERFGFLHPYQCKRNAVVERDGISYCKQHDPEEIKKRDAERDKRWAEELKAGNEKSRRDQAMRQACAPFTTEALEDGVIAEMIEMYWSLVQQTTMGEIVSDYDLRRAKVIMAKLEAKP